MRSSRSEKFRQSECACVELHVTNRYVLPGCLSYLPRLGASQEFFHYYLLTMTEEFQEDSCYVALTEDHLDIRSVIEKVRSPKAGAIVLFAGCLLSSFWKIVC